LVTCVPAAQGGFAVSINGTQVALDNSVGDLDSSANSIRYVGQIDGYQIRLTSSTEIGLAGAHITTTELHILSTADAGQLGMPLAVTILENFSQPPGFRGPMTLTNTLARNNIAGFENPGFDNLGIVSSTTSAGSAGGSAGTTGEVTLTGSADAGTSYGSFERAAEEYFLSQTVTVSGLRAGKKVVVTAGSAAETSGQGEFLVTAPAPASLTLLALGVALVGVYRLRAQQFRPRV